MSEYGKPGTCWAMVKMDGSNRGQHGNETPCPTTVGNVEYEVRGRMSGNHNGVTPGMAVRMWLCAKHAQLMKRRGYTLRAIVPDRSGAVGL
jgi:hypothetical protein